MSSFGDFVLSAIGVLPYRVLGTARGRPLQMLRLRDGTGAVPYKDRDREVAPTSWQGCPSHALHSLQEISGLNSYKINYLPWSDTMRILYPDETLTPFATNAGMWCVYVSSDNGLVLA